MMGDYDYEIQAGLSDMCVHVEKIGQVLSTIARTLVAIRDKMPPPHEAHDVALDFVPDEPDPEGGWYHDG